MHINKVNETILIALAGALSVFSFAPFYLFPAMWISLAIFFISISQTSDPLHAAWRGLIYGSGFYLANVHWIYISLHKYGGMPIPVAIFLVFLLSLYLALFPALATYISFRFALLQPIRILVALPVLWTLGEWTRSWLFTGFPWAQIGYSQLPDTPLAGFAPLFGVYGVSFLLIFSVALAVWGGYFARRQAKYAVLGLCCIWGTGFGMRFIDWTQPQGKALSVSVIQGNISQSLKWRPDMLPVTLDTYLYLVGQSTGDLIILPETAIPVFLQNLPTLYIDRLRMTAAGRALIAGAPVLDKTSDRYYNSAALITDKTLPVYSKHHLVPFGEYIPLRALLGWIFNALHIPLTDFVQGDAHQSPFAIKDQQIALNICYEDAFGEEILNALPRATILANISNLAWFDASIALAQHGQIAQARALETGRPMVRATNTGLTAIIDYKGQFIDRAAIQQEAVLTAVIQGRAGMTPYARTGNVCILILLGCSSLFAIIFTWRKS